MPNDLFAWFKKEREKLQALRDKGIKGLPGGIGPGEYQKAIEKLKKDLKDKSKPKPIKTPSKTPSKTPEKPTGQPTKPPTGKPESVVEDGPPIRLKPGAARKAVRSASDEAGSSDKEMTILTKLKNNGITNINTKYKISDLMKMSDDELTAWINKNKPKK